mgnify:CR=1 FL=1
MSQFMLNQTNSSNLTNKTFPIPESEKSPGTQEYLMIGFLGFLFLCMILVMLNLVCSSSYGYPCISFKCCFKKRRVTHQPNPYYDPTSSDSDDSDLDHDYIYQNNQVIFRNYYDNSIPIQSISTISNRNLTPLFCSICQTYQKNTISSNCYHNFCKDCIQTHLTHTNRCPNCGQSILKLFEFDHVVINLKN